jgi:hypothetical protein
MRELSDRRRSVAFYALGCDWRVHCGDLGVLETIHAAPSAIFCSHECLVARV